MTIRTESKLDSEILNVLEKDRQALDRFATTPNTQLLSALTASKPASSGLFAFTSVKALAVAAFLSVGVAAVTYFGSNSPVASTMRPVTQPTAVDSTHSIQGAPVQNRVSASTERHIAHVAKRLLSRVEAPTTSTKAAVPTRGTSPTTDKPVSIDRWSSDTPQVIQLPNKLEVVTKSK